MSGYIAMTEFDNTLIALKHKIKQNNGFNTTYEYYINYLAYNQSFTDSSNKVKHPALNKSLKFTGKHLFGERMIVKITLITKLKTTRSRRGLRQ